MEKWELVVCKSDVMQASGKRELYKETVDTFNTQEECEIAAKELRHRYSSVYCKTPLTNKLE